MLYFIGRVLIFGFSVSLGVMIFIVGCFFCDMYLFFCELLKEVIYYFCVYYVVFGLFVNDFFLLVGIVGWVVNDVMSY